MRGHHRGGRPGGRQVGFRNDRRRSWQEQGDRLGRTLVGCGRNVVRLGRVVGRLGADVVRLGRDRPSSGSAASALCRELGRGVERLGADVVRLGRDHHVFRDQVDRLRRGRDRLSHDRVRLSNDRDAERGERRPRPHRRRAVGRFRGVGRPGSRYRAREAPRIDAARSGLRPGCPRAAPLQNSPKKAHDHGGNGDRDRRDEEQDVQTQTILRVESQPPCREMSTGRC